MKNKMILSWLIAILITFGAAIYQRTTGPTYPKITKVEIKDTVYKLKLIRSFGGTNDADINLDIPNKSVNASLYYRKYPTKDEWKSTDFVRESNKLVAKLPNQPPAGKLEYYIDFEYDKKNLQIFNNNPIIIRFKGDVPSFALIPHIFFMFFAMLISTLAGFLVIFKHPKYRLYGNIAFFLLVAGGMILGPVVQKYAFGEFWTGIPFGWDLTDNKTLIAFSAWIIAFFVNLKKEKPVFVLVASIVLLLIYSIPHSMFGSELNHETGGVTQGFIYSVFYLF